VVEGLLAELELDAIPCVNVFNKIDRLAPEDHIQIVLSGEGVGISARDAGTLEPLLVRAQEVLKGALVSMGKASPAENRRERGGGEGSF
jgi:GTP-binding protein HflX